MVSRALLPLDFKGTRHSTMNYEDYRRNYVLGGLRRSMLADCPIEQFQKWQEQAISAGLKDPTAASLATLEPDGHLWQRIILLKGIESGGFVFYTNYQSNKGRALMAEPRASLLFPWNEIDRQVTVSGRVEPVAESTSDAYFGSRPRASQLGAWASQQSRPIADREALEQQYAEVLERFEGSTVPRPSDWGGFRLVPTILEFWQGGEHRLHDRFRYELDGDGRWHIGRLQP